jgi:predicted TIM-barrel fold metal-dependent hydrolase
MVVGGVMERHPGLRVGVIELGAWWIGPLMEGLDLWYANSKTFNLLDERSTPQPPSHYIRRNVRVTPYSFEDVGALITKYDLADMLCFSTDYPHLEGGKGVFNRMYKTLAHLGGRVVEKYFVTNGEWLFPG